MGFSFHEDHDLHDAQPQASGSVNFSFPWLTNSTVTTTGWKQWEDNKSESVESFV